MIRRSEDLGLECVAIDLNTQRSFCETGGSLCVANVTSLIPALRRVVAWAKRNGTPVVSSMDSLQTTKHGPSGAPVMARSEGHRKVDFTVLPQNCRIEADNTLAIPLDLFSRHQQLIFQKRAEDLLTNPKADRFLTQLKAKEIVVFGNAVERSVKALVLALLARNKPVTVITDACGYWDSDMADFAMRQMEAKGACMISVDELLTRKLARHRRYRPRRASRWQGDNGTSQIDARHNLNGHQQAGAHQTDNGRQAADRNGRRDLSQGDETGTIRTRNSHSD